MSIVISSALKSLRLQAITTYLDSGSTGGVLKVYSGTQPTGGGSPTGDLLATLIFPKPSLDNVASGVMTVKPPASDTADASGTATWVRLETSAGAWVADLNAGAAGSGASCIFDTTSVYTGGTVSAVSISLTE